MWDDLGDLGVTEGQAPPAFEARQTEPSPLARLVEAREDGDAQRPEFDPNDPPPPFPADAPPLNGLAQRPRSPPPSFDVAVAQLQVNAQIRRASSVRSSFDRSEASSVVEYGPWTESEERLREERAAWEKDIEDGLGFEERLARVAARMAALEASGNDDASGTEAAGNDDDGNAISPAPDMAQADTFVEPEPVSRFSREEKGKGKAVDARGAVPSDVKPQSVDGTQQLADGTEPVNGLQSKPVLEETERPSRSYIVQSPRERSNTVETLEVDKVSTVRCGPAYSAHLCCHRERPTRPLRPHRLLSALFPLSRNRCSLENHLAEGNPIHGSCCGKCHPLDQAHPWLTRRLLRLSLLPCRSAKPRILGQLIGARSIERKATLMNVPNPPGDRVLSLE